MQQIDWREQNARVDVEKFRGGLVDAARLLESPLVQSAAALFRYTVLITLGDRRESMQLSAVTPVEQIRVAAMQEQLRARRLRKPGQLFLGESEGGEPPMPHLVVDAPATPALGIPSLVRLRKVVQRPGEIKKSVLLARALKERNVPLEDGFPLLFSSVDSLPKCHAFGIVPNPELADRTLLLRLLSTNQPNGAVAEIVLTGIQ